MFSIQLFLFIAPSASVIGKTAGLALVVNSSTPINGHFQPSATKCFPKQTKVCKTDFKVSKPKSLALAPCQLYRFNRMYCGSIQCKWCSRLVNYPGLFLLLSSVLINLIACYALLDYPSPERQYVGAVWISALVISTLWGLSVCWDLETGRLKACMIGSIVGTGYGWALGAGGVVLLRREEAANEESAVVLMNVPMLFVIGCAELGCFFVYLKQYRKAKKLLRIGSEFEENQQPENQREAEVSLVSDHRPANREEDQVPFNLVDREPANREEDQVPLHLLDREPANLEEDPEVPDNSEDEMPPLAPAEERVATQGSNRQVSTTNVFLDVRLQGSADRAEPYYGGDDLSLGSREANQRRAPGWVISDQD